MTFTIMDIRSDSVVIYTEHAKRNEFAAYFPSAKKFSHDVVCAEVKKRDLFSAMRDIADVVNNVLRDECIFDVE